jgi:hypothetical protein
MARNRVIYQSELLFVSDDASSTGITNHEELKRVQSANYGFSVTRQDVNEYGHQARIDSLIIDPPTVNLDFSYYLTDGFNERALGFYVRTGSAAEGGFASGHLQTSSGRNLFITVHGEGVDADLSADTAPDAVIGIGNAYLSDYTADFAVGSLPTVTVTMEGANINCDDAVTELSGWNDIENPAINVADGTKKGNIISLPTGILDYDSEAAGKISALRPGDVNLSISTAQSAVIADLTPAADAIHVQNASISIPLSRSNLTKLGTKFDYAKVVDFPVNATLSVSAVLNEVQANNLVDIIDVAAVDVSLSVADPAGGNAVVYTLKNVEIDSENFSSSIGADKTVDMTFTTQIGSAADTTNGIFMSGKNSTPVFV